MEPLRERVEQAEPFRVRPQEQVGDERRVQDTQGGSHDMTHPFEHDVLWIVRDGAE